MSQTNIREQNVKTFERIYPVYFGFSADLLFWVAIDSLFLTIVKSFSPSQIVFITDFALIVSILLNVPIRMIVSKIGNIVSVRLGSLFVMIASVILTFSSMYPMFLLGMTLKYIGVTFYEIHSVILKNNLKSVGRSDDFSKIQIRGYTFYSSFTAVIAFIATPMFNLNNYLPMYCCIGSTVIAFTLSWFLRDYSGDIVQEKVTPKTKQKFRYKELLPIILVFGLSSALLTSSQQEGKLFSQGVFFRSFSEKQVVLLIGAMICISRIVRIASNIVSYRLYRRLKRAIYPVLMGALLLALLLSTFGSFVTVKALQVVIMILGYIIILFLRDPYKVFMYDLALTKCNEEEQKSMVVYLQLSYKIFYAVFLLGVTALIKIRPMISMMILLIIVTSIAVGLNFYVTIKDRRG